MQPEITMLHMIIIACMLNQSVVISNPEDTPKYIIDYLAGDLHG